MIERLPGLATTDDLIERFALDQFRSAPQKNMGFGGALDFTGKKDDFFVYSLELPRILKQSKRECHYCDGTKSSGTMVRVCDFCSGTGLERYCDWKKAIELSATLSALMPWINSWQGTTSCDQKQLLMFETTTFKSKGCGPGSRIWHSIMPKTAEYGRRHECYRITESDKHSPKCHVGQKPRS